MGEEDGDPVKLDLIQGDCLTVLPTLHAGSVHCCVTSPPYWGLRDYGVDGQLGLEATPDEYVAKMIDVFRAVRRVLRDDGTLWLNLGDAYAHGTSWGGGAVDVRNAGRNTTPGDKVRGRMAGANILARGLKPKDLVGMPWAIAFALRADGWYLRSDIIWHKPNPMPESCTDRPTKSHEYLFLLTKSAKYFYDADAIREPIQTDPKENYPARARASGRGNQNNWQSKKGRQQDNSGGYPLSGAGRNKRSVWTIPTQPYSKAHFATFPEALVLPCILAGTSEEGCCAGCGAPYVRVVDKSFQPQTDVSEGLGKRGHEGQKPMDESNSWQGIPRGTTQSTTTGWQPTCTCDAETVPCTVCDPFLGSGTTAKVAQQYGQSFVGIELSREYLELARERFNQPRLFI